MLQTKTYKQYVYRASAMMLCVVMLTSFAASGGLSKKKIKERFFGVWELASFSSGGSTAQIVVPGKLKVFDKDGSYRFLSVAPNGTAIVQQGKFRVVSDSVYNEDIKFATNPNLRNVESAVSYTFASEDVLLVKGTVGGVDFDERWQRVKISIP